MSVLPTDDNLDEHRDGAASNGPEESTPSGDGDPTSDRTANEEGRAVERGDSLDPADGSGTDEDLETLRRERDELHDRLLRAMADHQNYVRRSHQNVAEAREQQLMDVALALVTVLDHFDHALAADPEKTTTESLFKGVKIVRDELMRTLEQFGVQRVDAEPGESFDPSRHEALMRQAVEGIDPDHVGAELQPGYSIGSKMLRPVKVSVSE